MADGSSIEITLGLKSETAPIFEQWKIWHDADTAGYGLALDDPDSDEVARLDDISDAAFKNIEGCESVSPIAIAARLHMALAHAAGDRYIQDLPYSLMADVLRDLLPFLPAEMATVIGSIVKTKAELACCKPPLTIGQALGRNEVDDEKAVKEPQIPSVIEATTVRWLHLAAHWWSDEQWQARKANGGQSLGSDEWDTLRNAALMTRANSLTDAAFQAYMLDTALDELDSFEPPQDFHAAIAPVATAAHSLALYLTTAMAPALGTMFQSGGIAEPLNRKFGPAFGIGGSVRA